MHSCNKIVLTYRSCGRLRHLRFERGIHAGHKRVSQVWRHWDDPERRPAAESRGIGFLGVLVEFPARDSAPTVGSRWESSHRQSNTATARRSPTLRLPTVVVGATGSTRAVLSLLGKLSMRRAEIEPASRCDTPTPSTRRAARHVPQDRRPRSQAQGRSAFRCSGRRH